MTLLTGIYRWLDFGINTSDESDEHVSQQEIKGGGPNRKRKISELQFCFPRRKSREKKFADRC